MLLSSFIYPVAIYHLFLNDQVHAHHNFGPLTAYLSINYLDRFLSSYELPVRGKYYDTYFFNVMHVAMLAT